MVYSICETTGLRVVDITEEHNIFLREDGYIRLASIKEYGNPIDEGQRIRFLNLKNKVSMDWRLPPLCDKGYRRFHHSFTGKNKHVRTHTLLATYFIPNTNPETYKFIDHIDGDRANNALNNLRWCTIRENAQNQTCHRTTTKLLGAHFRRDIPRKKPWSARISVQGKRISLGSYATEQEAHEAYMNYIKENHL